MDTDDLRITEQLHRELNKELINLKAITSKKDRECVCACVSVLS